LRNHLIKSFWEISLLPSLVTRSTYGKVDHTKWITLHVGRASQSARTPPSKDPSPPTIRSTRFSPLDHPPRTNDILSAVHTHKPTHWSQAGKEACALDPYTVYPTPHTPHPTPYTPHPTPHTLHPTPYTLVSASYTNTLAPNLLVCECGTHYMGHENDSVSAVHLAARIVGSLSAWVFHVRILCGGFEARRLDLQPDGKLELHH